MLGTFSTRTDPSFPRRGCCARESGQSQRSGAFLTRLCRVRLGPKLLVSATLQSRPVTIKHKDCLSPGAYPCQAASGVFSVSSLV